MKKPDILTQDVISGIYKNVFRKSTEQTGFYYLNLGSQINSQKLRRLMVGIKNELSVLCKKKLGEELYYQSLGRFSHQNTSKPHRDSADNHSFLILGYEPTVVKSKAYITDYSKYIEDEGISLETFFGDDKEVNLVEDIACLEKYKIEIKPFDRNDYRIIIANNSRSYKEKTWGVFHSAEILERIENQDRVLNYMMLKFSDLGKKEEYTLQNVEEFLTTDIINR